MEDNITITKGKLQDLLAKSVLVGVLIGMFLTGFFIMAVGMIQ